jgi:hypothetical protein
MAKKENPWIPSGGVLVVAVIAAVLAAFLLNVYIGLIKAPYEVTVPYLRVRENVAKGDTLEEKHLEVVELPEPLVASDALEGFVRLTDRETILRKKVVRDLPRGRLLAFSDVAAAGEVPILPDMREDYELVKVNIEPDELLQPGMFVTLRGKFDVDPDAKREQIETKDVLYGVQVKAVGGSTSVTDERRRNTDSIQIAVPSAIVKKLGDVKEKMATERFEIGILSPDSDKVRGEPTLAPEALDLLRGPEGAVPVIP